MPPDVVNTNGRRTSVQFLSIAHHIVFSSPSHFVCSIELKECCDGFARKDWIPVHQKMRIAGLSPKSSLLRCPILLHLPCSLFCALTARLWLVEDKVPYIPTLWQTSLKRSAVISGSSFWRIDGYPPRGQFSAWSTVNFSPQTQWESWYHARAKTKISSDVLGPKIAARKPSHNIKFKKFSWGSISPDSP